MNCITALKGIRHRFVSGDNRTLLLLPLSCFCSPFVFVFVLCCVLGADEKVVRVFFAPTPFLSALQAIAGVSTTDDALYQPASASASASAPASAAGGSGAGAALLSASHVTTARAVRAALPELGLSNKVWCVVVV